MFVFGVFRVRIFPRSDWIQRYNVSLRIQSKYRKIRTWEAPNTYTFHAGLDKKLLFQKPEANVKTNKMGRTKRAYNKGCSFASNHFIFLKILFQFKNLLWRVDWCTIYPNVHIHTFRWRWSFIWGCFFLWISLRDECVGRLS